MSGVNTGKADSLEAMVHLEGLTNSEGERTKVISPVEGVGQRWKGRKVKMLVSKDYILNTKF